MKKIIALLIAFIMSVSVVMSVFTLSVFADVTDYVKKWNISEEMLSVMEEYNGSVPQFDNTPFEFISNYYGTTGFNKAEYNEGGTSAIYGKSDNASQVWKAMLYATTVDAGVGISSASSYNMTVTFTAPCSGEYVLVPEAIGGSHGDYSIYSSNGEYDVNVSVSGEETYVFSDVVAAGEYSDFEEVTLNLIKGDVVSFVFNAPGYTSNGYRILFNFSFLLMEERINTVLVSEAVYETVEYNVSEELLNNTGTWNTAYQNSANFTYDGALVPVYVAIADLAYGDAFNRINTDYDSFSNANQSYEAHTVRAYTDGSMRWIYDYGSYRMGFRFTAEADAEYVLTSDVFTATGINAYVYELSGSALTLVGDAVAVSATEGLNITIDAAEGETYYIVLGKASAGWNAKKDCTTSWMKLSYKTLVSPAVYEDTDYIFQENAEYYIKNAEYLITEDDFLTVTIGASSAYTYAVWVQQLYDNTLRWVPLEEIDDGQYALMNAYETDGMFKFCIMAYDSYGMPITTSYFNKITEISPEESGSAVVENVFVNGNPVSDTVVIDKADGDFNLEYTGENIAKAAYSFGGRRVEFVDTAEIEPLATGKMYLTLDAYSSVENGQSDHRVITVYVYDSESVNSYKDLTGLDASFDTESGMLTYTAAASENALYSYSLFSNFSELLYSVNNIYDSEYTMSIGENAFGMFSLKVGVKDSVYGGEHDKIVKSMNIARPGGEWTLNATLDSSSSGTVLGSIGSSYELKAEASFSGDLSGEEIEYRFYIKDYEGTKIALDWSDTDSWSFTPAYSGRYVLGVAAKGSLTNTAEITKEFYLEVEGETSAGTVSISTADVEIGMPVVITADYSESDSEIANYRFWIITDSYVEIIQNYSASNSCVWIPKTSGEYKIRVDVINQNSFGMYDVNAVKTVMVK